MAIATMLWMTTLMGWGVVQNARDQQSTPEPIYVYYPDADIGLWILPSAEVNRLCIRPGDSWDDGAIVREGDTTSGCWLRGVRQIIVENSCAGLAAIAHELCHADGQPTRICNLIHVRQAVRCRTTSP